MSQRQTQKNARSTVRLNRIALNEAISRFEKGNAACDFRKAASLKGLLSRERLRVLTADDGKPINVKMDTVVALAHFLGVSPDSLIDEKVDAAPYATMLHSMGILDCGAAAKQTIAGHWKVSLSLDNDLLALKPWSLEQIVKIDQYSQQASKNDPDSHVNIIGFSMDFVESGIKCRWIFSGTLLESGTVLMGTYKFLQPDGKPKHGHVVAMRKGDSINGQYLGRSPNYDIVRGEMKATKVS